MEFYEMQRWIYIYLVVIYRIVLTDLIETVPCRHYMMFGVSSSFRHLQRKKKQCIHQSRNQWSSCTGNAK